MKNSFSNFLVFGFMIILGCGELELPEPEYYRGWEQLNVRNINWPKGCHLPNDFLIVSDTTQMKMNRCAMDFKPIDFDKFDILLYKEGVFLDITELKVGAYYYVNHQLKLFRLETVTRTRPNRSGLTSNGFTGEAHHSLLVPKVPDGYMVEVVNR